MAGFRLSSYERSLIYQHVLKCSAASLLMETAPIASPAHQAEIDRLIHEREINRVPLQYLLGEAWFYGRRFRVSPAVLIPRPETELLCEAVLSWIKVQPSQTNWRLVDVGTGSGCIAIMLALELAKLGLNAQVTAVDNSAKALEIAKQNADDLAAVVKFQPSDLLKDVQEQGPWDVIVSNPPYIDRALADTLEPEVLHHEPHSALFAQERGFALVHQLGGQAGQQLRPNSLLAVEVGQAMAAPLADRWRQTGFELVEVVKDYAGIGRIVLARRGDI